MSPAVTASYMREWRARNPQRYQEFKAKGNLRRRALTELGRRHAEELEEIIEALRRSRG